MIHDIERKGKTPWEVIKQLISVGNILDASIDFEAVGSLDSPTINTIPLLVVHATVVDPSLAETLYQVSADKIQLLSDPHVPLQGKRVPSTLPVPTRSSPAAMPAATSAAACTSAASLSDAQTSIARVPAISAASEVDDSSGSAVQSSIAHAPVAENTLRVNVAILDNLMNLAGELVLGRNQLREALSHSDQHAVEISSQRISMVSSELQEAIIQTRMQPIGNVFNKFTRVVRDMSRALKKDIRLDIEGRDVELDKTLIEGLSDPLTHMVRNAVDHGIDSSEARSKLGKPPAGVVTLRAYHEAGSVVVEVIDDGKGMDPQRIATAAIEKGLATAKTVQTMSIKEKLALILLPGLSTAEKVTDVSGRGVGMDVVKTNIDRLGGKLEIESMIGKGSCFRIKLPLTLAIIPSLIVMVSGERFAIPQVNLRELIMVPAGKRTERIGVVADAKVLLLRGEIIPLVDFGALLHGKESLCDDKTDLTIAVISTGTIQYGLIVDSFVNTEEIVVKPLGRHLKEQHEYAGAAIMGDGKVALILDAGGLAAKAKLAAVAEATAQATAKAREAAALAAEGAGTLMSLLLFHNCPTEVCALPVDMIRRIERVQRSQIETLGGHRSMQYRGGTLPLVTLSDIATLKPIPDTQDLVVAVCTVANREVGLLASMPVDAVDARIVIDTTTLRQRGITGSAIINSKTVLMADMPELVKHAYPDWAPEVHQPEVVMGKGKSAQVILLAEDSDFFRTRERQIIEAEGYAVLDAPDGEAAWQLLKDNSDQIRMVITDIEMPRLTGLGLIQRIRAEPKFAGLPVIALSSLAGEEDIQRGMAAGSNDYQVKLDRDKLLEGLRRFLNH